MPNIISSAAKIFADDTKIYRKVSSEQDRQQLQSEPDAVSDWSVKWQLPFNSDKCTVLRVGSRNSEGIYTLNGLQLKMTDSEKDLGIFMDTDLKFRKQAASAVAKASQILALIRRSFQAIDCDTLPGSSRRWSGPIWSMVVVSGVPSQRWIRRLSNVCSGEPQDSFRGWGRRRTPNSCDCSTFHLSTIEDAGGHDTYISDPAPALGTGPATRKLLHPSKILKNKRTPVEAKQGTGESRVQRHCFSVRVVNDWNALPSDVVQASSLNQFKAHLDAHWAGIRFYIPDWIKASELDVNGTNRPSGLLNPAYVKVIIR